MSKLYDVSCGVKFFLLLIILHTYKEERKNIYKKGSFNLLNMTLRVMHYLILCRILISLYYPLKSD